MLPVLDDVAVLGRPFILCSEFGFLVREGHFLGVVRSCLELCSWLKGVSSFHVICLIQHGGWLGGVLRELWFDF